MADYFCSECGNQVDEFCAEHPQAQVDSAPGTPRTDATACLVCGTEYVSGQHADVKHASGCLLDAKATRAMIDAASKETV